MLRLVTLCSNKRRPMQCCSGPATLQLGMETTSTAWKSSPLEGGGNSVTSQVPASAPTASRPWIFYDVRKNKSQLDYAAVVRFLYHFIVGIE
ncbi:Wash Complex Subunit 2C [Manis pentadactyla]|nr:Wash Complex Subunit 2C [Manis pentadactyla]